MNKQRKTPGKMIKSPVEELEIPAGGLVTASEDAKKVGLKSLKEAAEMTDTSFQTLNNWYNDKPKLFAVVMAGCAAMRNTEAVPAALTPPRAPPKKKTRKSSK